MPKYNRLTLDLTDEEMERLKRVKEKICARTKAETLRWLLISADAPFKTAYLVDEVSKRHHSHNVLQPILGMTKKGTK